MTLQEIKNYIIARIYPNTQQEITGQALQDTLTTMAEELTTREDFEAYKSEATEQIADRVTASEFETYQDNMAEALGGKQDTLTLSVNDNGNIVIGNLAGQSKEFMPATPSGVPEHYTWLAIDGVTYGSFIDTDGNTYGQDGKWGVYAKYGGLADLSNDDMCIVMAEKQSLSKLPAIFAGTMGRTNIIVNNNTFLMVYTGEFSQIFRNCTKLEVANLCSKGQSKKCEPVNLSDSFSGCRAMHTIIGEIGGRYLTNTARCFNSCTALEEVRISGLKVSISFADSPNLSKESILYMIEKEAATSAIVITLHATAYAMATADSDISAALAEHTNVSLASA